MRFVIIGGTVCVAIGLVALYEAVYGITGSTRNAATDPVCRPAAEIAQRLAPLARGEVAAVTVPATPRRLPELSFQDSTGQNKTLADWRGRTVLFNLWATWCVPCKKEMPALDTLQAKLGGQPFEVVAVNIDTRDPDKSKDWLKSVGIKQLAYYADPTAKVFQDLKVAGKAVGMPTTLLIDGAGCELGTISGPAEWASDDAVVLLSAAMSAAPK